MPQTQLLLVQLFDLAKYMRLKPAVLGFNEVSSSEDTNNHVFFVFAKHKHKTNTRAVAGLSLKDIHDVLLGHQLKLPFLLLLAECWQRIVV